MEDITYTVRAGSRKMHIEYTVRERCFLLPPGLCHWHDSHLSTFGREPPSPATKIQKTRNHTALYAWENPPYIKKGGLMPPLTFLVRQKPVYFACGGVQSPRFHFTSSISTLPTYTFILADTGTCASSSVNQPSNLPVSP